MSQSPHDENGARGVFYDAFSRAANEQPRDCATAMGSNDNQIDLKMVGHQDNLIKRISHAQVGLDFDTLV
jgi:hypothetical protein